ncbi:flagellar hook-basal body protein [Arenimonas terrae]|uniref:Flagellar hook basal-body protein n=1 Tax=Arenimonas terrae TaxID=2546226 RepID=A0A5C4RPQ6_9GAMM|nr:flagellar hook basal-body protein [Arenimonas terrae]TNJ33243.1 flagellar hook basal-body protein [Arenimonas terrae]
MTETISAIARSLSGDVDKLNAVSQNVANMHTPGYRGARPVQDFSRATRGMMIDQRDGAIVQTYQPLDFALRGPGFFVVQRGEREVLVRSGAFRLDAAGNLATAYGDRVLGDVGPITLPPGKVSVGRDGQLRVDGKGVDRLRIVEVAEPSRLAGTGGGAFFYEGDVVEWQGQLLQGALESANVDAAEETLRLIEATRHAESLQRAISIYDKVLDVGINQIGSN